MKFWLVLKTDGAALGLARGQQSQETMDGPFDSFDEAFDAKPRGSMGSASWITVVESETEPESTSEDYEFVDDECEFGDGGDETAHYRGY